MVKKVKKTKKIKKVKKAKKFKLKEKKESGEDKVEKKKEDSLEGVVGKEAAVGEPPLEIAEGIADAIGQVNVRDLLRHSGEVDQATRADLEEELAWQSWRPEDEEGGSGRGVNYGGVKEGKGDKDSHYKLEKDADTDPTKKTYEALDLYESKDNFYDASHEKLKDGEIGQVRGLSKSRLEISGISKERELSSSDFSMDYPEEEYE